MNFFPIERFLWIEVPFQSDLYTNEKCFTSLQPFPEFKSLIVAVNPALRYIAFNRLPVDCVDLLLNDWLFQ